MKTTVVNIRNAPCDVFIGRGSIWGNPYVTGVDGTREQVIVKYGRYIALNDTLRKHLPELKGKVLGCYCKPLSCHGDILARMADATD